MDSSLNNANRRPFLFTRRLTVLGCAMRMVNTEVPPPSTPEVSGFRMMFNAYRQCSDQPEMVVCLKSRALRMLDRAIHMENIQITDGNVKSSVVFTILLYTKTVDKT